MLQVNLQGGESHTHNYEGCTNLLFCTSRQHKSCIIISSHQSLGEGVTHLEMKLDPFRGASRTTVCLFSNSYCLHNVLSMVTLYSRTLASMPLYSVGFGRKSTQITSCLVRKVWSLDLTLESQSLAPSSTHITYTTPPHRKVPQNKGAAPPS